MRLSDFRTAAVAASILLVAASSYAKEPQQFKYKWDVVPIDDRWDFITDSTATKLIKSYDYVLSPLKEVVGKTDRQYAKKRPESGLSNFVVDAIKTKAQQLDKRHIDLALTNFGGIRTDLPKGDVTMYDIYSIFPFRNYLVVFDISGKDIIEMIEKHAKRPEAMSGVTLVVEKGKVTSLEVGGRPVDPERTYVMASINFLMTGGDGFCLNQYAKNKVEYEDVLIRDAIVDAFKAAGNNVISLKKDGRTVITK